MLTANKPDRVMTARQIERRIAQLEGEIGYHRMVRDNPIREGYMKRSMLAIARKQKQVLALKRMVNYRPLLPTMNVPQVFAAQTKDFPRLKD